MKNLIHYRVASDASVARIGQMVCFLAACFLPVLVLRKLADLELSEAQLLLGVVTTMSAALMLTVLGLLLDPKRHPAQPRS